MKTISSLLLCLALTFSTLAEEKKTESKATPTLTQTIPAKNIAEHLQSISVTIRAENSMGAGEGSGVIFSRKDADGNLVNFVWTAAHVVDILRSERKVLVNGTPKTLVEFRDALIIKEIRQDGRIVGRLQMDAEVLKFSDAIDGHDLALLKIRKYNFVSDSVVFLLGKDIPSLGTDLLHVGSLLGQMGSNSMTDGIYSQHGRIIKEINKFVYDQTTCTAFPGSSGGGVYLKSDARYVGMLVRGAGEGFNLIVPVRRMISYCEEHKIMWALDHKFPMPSNSELGKLSIEHSPVLEERKVRDEKGLVAKEFPIMLRKLETVTEKVVQP